jgi:YegS/Rv2252/BmrU family lipid kinase
MLRVNAPDTYLVASACRRRQEAYNVVLGSFHSKRATIIYNPVARGLARRQHLLQRTIAVLARQGIEGHLVATKGPGTAGAQVRRQIDAGSDLIIAAGGDGTINEVANGLMHTGIPLAILPGGTANVLAREMRVPIHLEKAAAQVSNLVPHQIAAGALRIGGSDRRAFLCMAGVGLDAEIVSRLNLDLKAAAGKLAYYIAGFGHVFRPLKEFYVTVDGRRFEASFALISRVRNYGGDLEIARGASLLRDDFEVVLFRGTASARYLHYFLGVALKRVEQIDGCTVVHGTSITCSHADGNGVYVQIDGELAGNLPITAEIIPEALTVLLPPEYIAREQAYRSISICA